LQEEDSVLLKNLGVAFNLNKDYQKALDHFEKTKTFIFNTLGESNNIVINNKINLLKNYFFFFKKKKNSILTV